MIEENIVRIINEYVQVGFARELAIFTARYLPLFLIGFIFVYVVYRLRPKIVGELHKGKMFPMLLKLVANAFVFVYFVFWRYVFGIQRQPRLNEGEVENIFNYSLDSAKMFGREYADVLFLVLDTVASSLLTLFTVNLLKITFDTDRPFEAMPDLASLFQFESLGSFPSGHSAIFFTLAVAIYKYNKDLGVVYSLLAILIGLARVASGVHYLIDILSGFVIGYLIAVFVQKKLFVDIRKKYGLY